MVTAPSSPRRDRIAIAGSIAVHCCVLAVVLGLPHPSFPAGDPDERTILTTVIRVDRREKPTPTPAPPRLAVHPRAAAAPVVMPTDLPVVHAAVAVAHAARRLVVAAEHRAAPVPLPSPVRHATAHQAPQVAAVVPAPAVHAASEAARDAPAATAAASPSPAPPAQVAERDDGIGNFGETYPASVDPSARGSLLAGFHGFDVRISIDETGRATAIEFVGGPMDPALREELRTRLLAQRFIPAACNGIRCPGSLELKS